MVGRGAAIQEITRFFSKRLRFLSPEPYFQISLSATRKLLIQSHSRTGLFLCISFDCSVGFTIDMSMHQIHEASVSPVDKTQGDFSSHAILKKNYFGTCVGFSKTIEFTCPNVLSFSVVPRKVVSRFNVPNVSFFVGS